MIKVERESDERGVILAQNMVDPKKCVVFGVVEVDAVNGMTS